MARAAREEPAFRAYALAALSSMDDMAAHDELMNLLEVPSSETRYGAFRALWAMNSNDPLIRGENLGGQFGYHVLNTSGPPMIHVTRSFRPEVVVFGHEQTLEAPFVLEAGKSILVKATSGDKVTVSKFVVGQPDQKRVVTTKVDEIIRAIVELGGTYPDVVQALQQAKTCQRAGQPLRGRRAAGRRPCLPSARGNRGRRRPAGQSGRADRGGQSRCPNCFRRRNARQIAKPARPPRPTFPHGKSQEKPGQPRKPVPW